MTYQVTVRRTEHREHTFKVEALSREEAEDKAMEAACDHDFGQNTVCHAEEEVASVLQVSGPAL